MLKFSAGYTKINPNFVIQNLTTDNGPTTTPVLAILNNVLQRGCPTIPSKFLQKAFGKPLYRKDFLYYYNFSDCNWNRVIKGGDISNPALNFYQKILPKVLGQYAKTFIAECPLTYIIEDYEDNETVSEQVDFYSPLFNAVIEIDGVQHITRSEQSIKDSKRNQLLKNHNVDIIRIKTSELNDFRVIKERFSSLKINEDYRKAIFNNNNKICNADINYMTATRIELLLLSLYEYGRLKLEDKELCINVFSAEGIQKNIFEKCIYNFLILLKSICLLQNIDFNIPHIQLILADSELALSEMQGINVCISLKDVYSQINFNNIIYIKNDFFLYEDNLFSEYDQNNGYSKYLYKKNYFHIKTQNVSYNLKKEKHSNVLKFLLRNISYDYDDFRANQLDIIIECLNERSVIGVLPTGAGKSLCYQLTSLLIPSITLTIAPLQLLMVDQYNNIKEKLGITNCIYINSTKRENLKIFAKNRSLITFISPERFFSEAFTNSLTNNKISIGFIVIDEAHCLSEWGHDFRTSYLCLSHNLSRFLPSDTFLMALTGTASHRVFEDIDCEFQNFKNKKTNAIFADNMRRDNLTIIIRRTENKYQELIDNISSTLIGTNKDKTLIFTKKKNSGNYNNTDSACISLTNKIKTDFSTKANTDIISYYSGGDELSIYQKEAVLQKFKKGKILIVVATKAFGMGVDIHDLRKTIHYGLPSSFESLYQQFGRAGRDGKPAKCYVYYTQERKSAIERFFKMPPISVNEMEKHLKELNELQTNFFFIQSANLDVETEEKVIKRLLRGIKIRNKLFKNFVDCKTIMNGPFKELNDRHLNSICADSSRAQTIIERALYRLFLLGEIEMWSIVYSADMENPTFNHLVLTNLNEEEKLERLKSHIEKYETSFKFNMPNTFENRLKFLLKWANENYLQERIQTLKTLYEQCEYYSDSDSFMTYISNYFSNDPIYMRLVDRNIRLKEWIDALKTHPEKTKARIARMLESYDKIVPLNYISGITRLRLDEFENTDGERRLSLALDEISQYTDDDRKFLFDNTYQILSDNHKEIFIECWLKHCKNDTVKIYESTNSAVCENYLIINFANELVKIGEKIDDKLQ